MLDGIWEILLHFGRFKNIDLYRQGIYFFRASVYTRETRKNEEKLEEVRKPILALRPFQRKGVNDMGNVRTGMLTKEEMKENPAKVIKNCEQFVTRWMRVRYEGQDTEIGESCLFRLSVPFSKKKTVFIDIDLLFAERHSEEYKELGIQGLENKFKRLETTTLVISTLTSIHKLYPVTFTDKYFCLLDLQVHVEFISVETKITCLGEVLPKQEGISVVNILSGERRTEVPTKKEWQKLEDCRQYYLKLLLRTHSSLYEIINDQQSIKSEHRVQILEDLGVSQYPIEKIETPGGKKLQNDGASMVIKSFYYTLTAGGKEEEKLAADKLTNIGVWNKILCEIQDLSFRVTTIWLVLIGSVPYFSGHVLRKYYLDWQKEFVDWMNVVIFRKIDLVSNRWTWGLRGSDVGHKLVLRKIRNQKSINPLPPPKVWNLIYTVPPKLRTVIFEHSFNAISEEKNSCACSLKVRQPSGGYHVIVLVHGYNGSARDMRLFKNHMQILLEHTDAEPLFLCSKANENEKTYGDIREMGKRLAKEVDNFIKLNCRMGRLGRISFVAHSLGGIIARAAFVEPSFEPYIKYLWTFSSLAVCHAGLLFGTVLARGGLAIIKKYGKSQSLIQLSVGEDKDPRKCFMYYLSHQEGLGYFQHVLLFSSYEDKYTPYHSARIERLKQDLPLAQVYNEMCDNLLKPLANTYLTRFDISFPKKQDFVGDRIGRSAHIFFLDRPNYVDIMLNAYKDFFV